MLRFWNEFLREAARPIWAHSLLAYVGLVTFLAVAAAAEHSLYFHVAYVFLPLGMAPLAAWVFVRDRASGMAQLHAVSPLSRRESFLAKASACLLFPSLAIALTAPVTAAMLSRSGKAAFALNAHYLGWGLLLAFAAALAGALAALFARRDVSKGVAIAFLVVIGWVGLAEAAGSLVALGGSAASARLISQVIHVSPVVWAYDALQPMTHPLHVESIPPPVGLALVLAAAAALAWVTWTRLQSAEGWETPHRRPAVLALAAVLGGAILLLSTLWPVTLASEVDRDVRTGRNGDFRLDFQGISPERGPRVPLNDGDRVAVVLEIHSQPGRSFIIDRFDVSSPFLVFAPVSPVPFTVNVPPQGPAIHRQEFTVTTGYVAGALPIEIEVRVDGETLHLAGKHYVRPTPASPASVLASALPGLALPTVLGHVVKRRMNAW